MELLKFSQANAKTRGLSLVSGIAHYLDDGRKVYSCDGRSGYDCPYAKLCKSQAIVCNGKVTIQDGPDTIWRCFSASQEVQYPNTRKSRKYNSDLFRTCGNVKQMIKLIEASLPNNLGICRIDVSGDFFNQRHFDAWLATARTYTDRLFYAYTKSIPFWIKRKHLVDTTHNFVLTASYGGTKDDLIEKHNLRYAKVVFSEAKANTLCLPIDHDDSHAADPSKQWKSFALLLHGTQPKGSEAAVALRELKGVGSYSRKKRGTK